MSYPGGRNKLDKRFRRIFKQLLSYKYLDLSSYSLDLNLLDADGRSVYYVNQEYLEESFDEFFLSEDKDSDDFFIYLVGYTGVGKTTIIRNYFKITNRTPFIDENENVICYFSCFSRELGAEEDARSNIDKDLLESISYIIRLAQNRIEEETDNEFLVNFYNFIAEDNETLLESIYINNESIFKREYTEEEKLQFFMINKPMEYYRSLLKYYLQKSKLSNIIFIFDDLEAVDYTNYSILLESFFKLSDCLRQCKGRTYGVKTMVPLRSHTYRAYTHKKSDPRRGQGIILKNTIPRLSDLVLRRMQYIEIDNPISVADIADDKKWEDAKSELRVVLEKVDTTFGDTIARLCNYNISNSLECLLITITNQKWFEKREKLFQGDSDGSFEVDSNDYYTAEIERLYRALILRSGDVYDSRESVILPNILYGRNAKEDVDIYNLLIMTRYINHKSIKDLIKENESKKNYSLYYGGDDNIVPSEFIKEFEECFKDCDEFNLEVVRNKLKKSFEFLYRHSILVLSIHEDDKEADVKVFDENRKVYLSPRGIELFHLIQKNTLLLEFYWDEIKNSYKGMQSYSYELSKKLRIINLIKYNGDLFEREKFFIQNCDSANEYMKMFGNNFISCTVMKGIYNTIKEYFNKKDKDYNDVLQTYNELYDKVHLYSSQIKNERSIDITLPLDAKRLLQ